MNYKNLIELALKGRSVNSMAKQWGIGQPTLQRYVTAERLPDFDLALRICNEAGVDPAEGFRVLAEEERNRKVNQFKLKMQGGFVQTMLLSLMGGGGVLSFFLYYVK